VTRSYRRGVQVVLTTVFIAAGICASTVSRAPVAPARAGQDLGPGGFPLGDFQLVERSGRTVTQADLADRVWIAGFIFTRCPLSCPRISSVMQRLQTRLARSNVLLVSISVDPENDTPAVLTAYARQFAPSPDRWWFLTGAKALIHDLVQNRFKLSLVETSPADRSAGAEVISHSDRLALVDRGQVVGFFESSDLDALDALAARASRLALPNWVRILPAVNASLNGLSAILLLAAWFLIRGRTGAPAAGLLPSAERRAFGKPMDRSRVRAHATCMSLAVATSAIFLASYLTYHSQAGSMPFRHGGPLRVTYFTILLSHTVLATGVVPLVVLTLARALRRDFMRHMAIAQVTFPIWLYVSITGVVIYFLLYTLPTASAYP
jgi:protein SCO1/2/putative membrane protein